MMCVDQIKCAHCKGYHESIAGIRACASVEAAQKAFLEATSASTQTNVARAAVKAAKTSVPAGRYALIEDGVVKFYVVDRPTEGKWAGRTFVSTQAGDETYPVFYGPHRLNILRLIAENVQGAMLLYGQEIGRCGHCGRTLTNETSRLAGIGPVCRARMGF